MNLLTRITQLFKTKLDTINPSAWFPVGFDPLNRKRTHEELYYGIVFACVDAIATSIASIKPELYLDDKDGNPNEIFNDPILKPLHRANKWQSGSILMYRIAAHIETHGKSYVWTERNLKGEPLNLYALNPAKIRVVYNNQSTDFDDYVKGFVYTNPSGKNIPLDVDEVIPIVRPHPFSDNPLDGISTIEMARLEIEADLNAQDYNKAFFTRGAKPSGILTTEEQLSEEAFDRLKKQWAEQNENKDAWRKTLILEQGLNYQQVSINQKDMDFIQQRKLSRDDVMAIFRVHKAIVAIADDVNRANAEAGEYVFAKYTLVPKLQMIYEQLNALYLPMFKDNKDKFLDFTNPVPNDARLEAETREKAIYKWKTINEIRAEDGLDDIGPNGDQLYLPINLMPLDFDMSGSDSDNNDNQSNDDKKNQTYSEEKSIEGLSKIVQVKSKERSFLIASRRYLLQRERQMTPAIRQLYSDLIREVRRTPINKAEEDTPEIILDLIMPTLDSFKNLTSKVLLRYNTDTFQEGSKKVNDYFEIPFSFDLVNSGAKVYLQSRANDTANSLRDSMLNKARKVISDVLPEQGFTLEKAKNEVLRVFKEEAEWRSQRIARTEVQNAYNEANFRSYSQSGMVEQIKWIVSKSPCEICDPNDQQVVKIGEPFPSGHTHPIAHPNCECAHVPYFGI